MLVGPTGGGKSTVRKILRRALVLLPTFQGAEEDEATTVEGSEIRESRSQTALPVGFLLLAFQPSSTFYSKAPQLRNQFFLPKA